LCSSFHLLVPRSWFSACYLRFLFLSSILFCTLISLQSSDLAPDFTVSFDVFLSECCCRVKSSGFDLHVPGIDLDLESPVPIIVPLVGLSWDYPARTPARSSLSVSALFFSAGCALGRPHCSGSHADLIWSAVPARGLFWFPARFACCGPKSAGRSACFGRRCQGFLIPISRYSAPPVFSLRFLHRSAADFLACSCWVRDFLPRAQGAARFLICVLALCSSFVCVGCQIMIVQI
jgi:hypothetical protein